MKNIMEDLNKIELRGRIGNVRLQNVGGKQVARFTVATDYIYKDKQGAPAIETTWHNVNAWEGKNISCLEHLDKGRVVYVVGRVRNQKYVGNDKLEKNSSEVLAGSVSIVEETN